MCETAATRQAHETTAQQARNALGIVQPLVVQLELAALIVRVDS